MKRITESLKYKLSPDELRLLGDDLARTMRDQIRVQCDKKTMQAHFASVLQEIDARMGDLSMRITTGYEMREMDCVVHLSTPKPGMKTIVRADNNEFVREEPMTPAEMQADFGFDPGRPGEP